MTAALVENPYNLSHRNTLVEHQGGIAQLRTTKKAESPILTTFNLLDLRLLRIPLTMVTLSLVGMAEKVFFGCKIYPDTPLIINLF